MNSPTSNPGDVAADRSSRTQQLIDECLRRRVAGEPLADEEVIAGHADLMPELGEGLRKLSLIERAVRRGRASRSQSSSERSVLGASAIVELPRDSFTGYDISEEVHRGGQAVVYRAIQMATKRKVAIKVMKEGPFAGPADKARFDREVQILGQLNHPNIVTIHDSGEAAGHFYYTMDYISGQPLDKYMAARQRSITDTLRLFAKVCDAVNAAHLRGVIHRDLKPSNIRVDAAGEPYILDFGLAKVITSDAEAPLMTMTGQFVGSLPWASPEQAEGSPSKIDLRTDVYSLGVILYQVLTGDFPYNVSGAMRDVLDRIITTEPARPSSIRHRIDNEVDTIVLKCLAKEPERRYQTAGELARDIHHYLTGEPIEAKRDSLVYMLRKHLRKYKLPVAVAAAFVVVVTLGFITSLTFWHRAAVALDRAKAAHLASEDSRAAEETQRKLAEREAAKARAVNEFLQDMLASVDPSMLGRDVKVREVLDQAAQRIADGSLAEQPEVEAAVRLTIGNAYRALGLYPAAEPHLRQALALRRECLGEHHPEVAKSLNDLAVLRRAEGDYDEAEALCREALTMRRALRGDEHLDVAESLYQLAGLLQAKGEYDASEELFREALAVYEPLLGSDHTDVAAILNDLAIVREQKSDYAEAEALCRRALAIYRSALGDEDPRIATTLSNLAVLLHTKGDYAQAETLFHEALAMRRKLLGNDHPSVAASLNNLAALVKDQGDYSQAEKLFREALAIRRTSLGNEHPMVATTLNNLGGLLTDRGDYAGAELLFREALEIRRKSLGDEHPRVATCLNNLAMLLNLKGDPVEAEALFRQALAIRRKVLGNEHPGVAITLNNLAILLRQRADYVEAEALSREAVAILRQALPDQHPKVAVSLSTLAATLFEKGDYAEAESLHREALAMRRATLPPGHRRTLLGLVKLSDTLVRQGKFAEAEPFLGEFLEAAHEALDQDDALIPEAQSILGAVLAGQGRFEEAEPLLLDSYAALAAEPQAWHDVQVAALQRIVDLYEAWGQPEKAAEWRAKPAATTGGKRR
jgi:tetratricopeptide (TPR) repeat protein